MFRRQVRGCDGGQWLQDLHEAAHQERDQTRLHGVQVGQGVMT